MISKSLLTVLLILEFLLVTGRAQSPISLPNESLRGLKNIAVVIDDVGTFAHPVGATADTPEPSQMKMNIELQLRKAGFNVIGSEDQVQKDKVPSLHVTLKAQKDGAGYNYYSLRIQLLQEVLLQRTPSVTVQASTWEGGATGQGFGKNIFQRTTCQVVAFFILSYNTINGGATPGKRPSVEDLMCLER
jgi:hypothetical protein